MARGGYRKGAGRKKGLTNKIVASEALTKIKKADCKNPLSVMISIMNDAYSGGDHRLALEAAKGAAPYIHYKLTESKVEVTQTVKPEDMTDEQLKQFCGESEEEGT